MCKYRIVKNFHKVRLVPYQNMIKDMIRDINGVKEESKFKVILKKLLYKLKFIKLKAFIKNFLEFRHILHKRICKYIEMHESDFALFRALQYILYDYLDVSKREKKLHGIYMFCGKFGSGKTLSMTEFIGSIKNEFGEERVKVYSNYGYKGGKKLADWEQVKQLFDEATLDDITIIAVDELQIWANAREALKKKFDLGLFGVLTNNRKKNFVFLFTTQSFDTVDINFRRLCNYVCHCRRYFWRFFRYKCYETQTYEKMLEMKTEGFPSLFKHSFVAGNFLYSQYDTYNIIEGFQGVDKK